MPTPNRVAKTETAPVENYTILDKEVEEINGVEVTAEHRKKGINLTASEALSYVASGTISLSGNEEQKGKASKAVAGNPTAQTGGQTRTSAE